MRPHEKFIYGFADLKGLLPEDLAFFISGISIGRRLDDAILDKVTDGPTLAYYEHYRSINEELAGISAKVCDELKKHDINCEGIKPTMVIGGDEFKPYFADLRYKVSHKMVATRAGLGWIGKTDLFVSKAFGTRLRLTSILISKPFPIQSVPVNKSRCGKCNICVERCPAHAATGKLWDIHTDRNEFFDPWKCRRMCAEMGLKYLKEDKLVCGVCVAVCPLGQDRKRQNHL